MRYECSRCGAIENTTNEPHLCKDLKKRLERQTKAVNAVVKILEDNLFFGESIVVDEEKAEYIAQEIVKKISGMHLE